MTHYRTLSGLALAMACTVTMASGPSDAALAKVLGVASLSHTVEPQTKHGMTFSDRKYRDAKNEVVVILRLAPAEHYDMWKQAAGAGTSPVSGLGSDAFGYKGMFGATCAKNAARAVCVSPTSGKKFTEAQVREAVKLALE